MKKTKNIYFSILFLICFLASFSLSTYKNIHTKFHKKEVSALLSSSLSSKDDGCIPNNDLILTENESELETDIHAQVFTLPFFISFFQCECVQYRFVSLQPLAEKLTTPIYIEVCNFRI